MAEANRVHPVADPKRRDGLIGGAVSRMLQALARGGPGAGSLRIWLHRWRGVKIGKGSWIGYDCILDTSYPWLITLHDRVTLSIRVTVIAHFGSASGVVLEDDVFVGPCATILPGITIGRGSVITAGTVVNRTVPPQTMVQGNPGKFVGKCTIPLTNNTSMQDFIRGYRTIR